MKYIKSALIVIACITANFVCMRLCSLSIQPPLVLNAVGTCFACCYTGLIGGIVCGAVSGLFYTQLGIASVFYCIIGAVISAIIYFCFKKELLYRFLTTVISGYWLGICSAILLLPVNIKFNNGYTGSAWGDALHDMLRHYNWSKVFSAFTGTLFIEIIDKQLTLLILFFALQIVSIYKNKKVKKAAREALRKSAAGILILCAAARLFCLNPVSADSTNQAYSDNKGFATQIYNKKDGLISSSANAIAQTDDGCLWVGSMDGLVKYDGTHFEHMFSGTVSNVTALLSDSRGRLLIGTLDKGLGIYQDGTFSYITTDDGLSSNTVRCLVEKSGIVYIATSGKICRLSADNKVAEVASDITYAHSMAALGGKIIGCDWNGHLFALDEKDKPLKIPASLSGIYFTCIAGTSKGVMGATNGKEIYTFGISDNALSISSKITTGLNNIHDICEGKEGRLWVCSENALGYFDTNGKYRQRHSDDIDFTYETLFVDYQNNAWITSSKYGLMKLSESSFLALSERGGVPSKPVNAAVKYNGMYYYGMDDGLRIHNRRNNSMVENELTDLLKGVSVRAMLVDDKNRLLICTYNSNGLIIYDGSSIRTLNEKNAGLTSNNLRNVIELKDGTIAVGTADGLNIIKDDKAVKTIKKKDGLTVSQILCIAQGDDGLIYAGTDGGGIAVISDGGIVETYTVNDGLSSDVIMRMLPYDNGMIVCTSGKLCYIKDGVKQLDNFPYEGSLDILKINDENAYLLGSYGVADVNLKELTAGYDADTDIYGENNGLMANVSRDSCNFIDDDNSLVFCTNMGVLSFARIERYSSYKYKFGITSLTCDGRLIDEDNGVYNIPKDTKYLSINASVRDYTLEDIRVKFYVEGLSGSYGNDAMQTMSYKKISPISIYNPTAGRHNVHLQLFDSDENLIEEKTYIISREMRMWEYGWFKAYAVFVLLEAVTVFSASVILIYVFSRRKNELESVRVNLERSVEEKTNELMQQQMRTIIALSDVIDAKDRYTSGHSARVAFYAKQIAARLKKSEEEQNLIYRAGLLHDIGKIRVPGSIISKPGKLTEDEYTLMKLHTVTGFHILKNVGGNPMFAQGAHFHHERFDGRGYPNGLFGKNIPEVARIIGVADAYDAMSSRRSYHDVFSQEYIMTEIKRGRGTQFDPEIADIMLDMMEEDNFYTMTEKHDKRVILVIDDEQKRIDEIREIMKDEDNYNIMGALTGEIGLSILEETNVDLVLLDMSMPVTDGMETFKHIREKHSVPVIFMIEIEQLYDMQPASGLGYDDFLTKPYVPIVLKEIIHNYTKTFDAGM